MSSLNLSHALVAGTNENVNDIQDNFDDIVAWSSQIDETNMSSSSGVFSAYRTIRESQGQLFGSSAAATWLFSHTLSTGGAGLIQSGVSGSTNGNAAHALYFDDADYTVSGKTQRLRVRAQLYVNGTAPGITYTVGLYPISSIGGTGSSGLTFTLGTVTAGSTVAIASPAANSKNQGNSGDFAVPSDGHYVLGVVLSGGQAANSNVAIASQLQTRWV